MRAEPVRWPGLARRGTVRFRVTLLATVAVAGVLLTSSLALISVQRGVLTHGIDEALRQRADNLQARVASWPPGAALPADGDQEDSFLQLLDAAGRVSASTANVRQMPAALRVRPGDPAESIRTVTDLSLSQGEFRVLARRGDAGGPPQTLLLGKNLDDVEESVHILAVSLSVSVPVVLALLAALVWWLTGRVLDPVESVRAEVASIQGDQLHRRVPVPGTGDEISRLAQTMNGMLDRVEEATKRQRVFVADASHELRGPLTRLRSELEVSLAHPHSTDPATVQQGLLRGVAELQRLVDDLLFLARSDSGSLGGPMAPVDLDDLVLAEAKRLRERGCVRVDTGGVCAARTLGDSRQLARAIGNLVANAERHARTVVSLEVRERADRSEVVVTDDGQGIPARHRTTVFTRFSRLDEARSRDAGGAGLGLAIVADIVARHGGTVVIGSATGAAGNGAAGNAVPASGGARFVVSLPRVD